MPCARVIKEDIAVEAKTSLATYTVSCIWDRLTGRTTVQPVTLEQYQLYISLQCNPRLLIKSPVMLLFLSKCLAHSNHTKKKEKTVSETWGMETVPRRGSSRADTDLYTNKSYHLLIHTVYIFFAVHVVNSCFQTKWDVGLPHKLDIFREWWEKGPKARKKSFSSSIKSINELNLYII